MENNFWKKHYDEIFNLIKRFSFEKEALDKEKNIKKRQLHELELYEIINETIEIIKSNKLSNNLFFVENSNELKESFILEDFRKPNYFFKDVKCYLEKVKIKSL